MAVISIILPCQYESLHAGNILATKNRIAHIRWRIQIIKTIRPISPKQNCLSQVFKERVGVRYGSVHLQRPPKVRLTILINVAT